MELVRMPKGKDGKAHCYICDRAIDERIEFPFDVERGNGSVERVNVDLRTIEVRRQFDRDRTFVFEICAVCALFRSPFEEVAANYRYGLDLPAMVKPGEERISYKDVKK